MTTNLFDRTYHEMLKKPFAGRMRGDRTGVGTTAVFGGQFRFDLSQGEFPLITTKKIFWKGVVHELLWFLSGNTNIDYLLHHGVNIWNEWAIPKYKEEPMSCVEINDRLREAIGIPNSTGLITIFKTDEAGEMTDEIVPLEQIAIGSDAHTEMVQLAASLATYHGVDIPTTKSVLVAGELGPVYGSMWRRWPDRRVVATTQVAHYQMLGYIVEGGLKDQDRVLMYREIDQISELIKGLKEKPFSRRHLVSGWHPSYLPDESASHHENVSHGRQALPPCHTVFQFFVEEMTPAERSTFAGVDLTNEKALDEQGVPRHRLSCQLYQRSGDVFLGIPFNIASYALLTLMVAQVVGMAPGEFIHTLGDLHAYNNHRTQIQLQLSRKSFPAPRVKLNPAVKDIFDFEFDDIILEGYEYHPAIPAPIAK